ncbi:zinc-binding dehydrogenase [Streptococcus caprae]|uniref:Zinc-binding dehydrogenase n=1 Tax=Streptococcus caprae TaxID=1640501 RepID=A0ABV8CT10_9STRE
MKTAIFEKAGSMILEEVAKPVIEAEDDVIIRIVRSCVCGSDLWSYSHGDAKDAHSLNSGHEALGIIEEAGSAITTVKPGDFVIVPFTHGCGECDACRAGFDGSCDRHVPGNNFSRGFQAEYIKFHYANWALIKVPGQPSDYTEGMLKSLLTLADVMPTGYHAARMAQVEKGDRVVVIGDGAVGQCAVIAAKFRGASQIIMMSRHADRQALALELGATAVVAERGEEGIAKVREILGGGADAALECVGTEGSLEQAMGVLHNGGRIGFVGVPHYNSYAIGSTFVKNTLIGGGPASVTTYVKQILLKAVLDGTINPGKVFTESYALADINQAYADMADRKTIKSILVVSQ